MGYERVFSYQQKLSYLILQDIRALRLVSFSVEILNLVRVCYFYTHANSQCEVNFM